MCRQHLDHLGIPYGLIVNAIIGPGTVTYQGSLTSVLSETSSLGAAKMHSVNLVITDPVLLVNIQPGERELEWLETIL